MDEEFFRKSIPGVAPPIFRGVVKRKHIHRCWEEKQDFYYTDTGYFGNFTSPGNPSGKKLFHRIVKNDLQKHWLENHPSDRWQEICKIDPRYQWKGWKKNGNKILVIVPNRKSCVFYGYDTEPYVDNSNRPWLMQTIETIKKHTDMEIIIREKGSRSARQHHSIFDALNEGIFATVAFNSIAALESVIYGVPSFVTVPCAASPLALTDLSQIMTPFYPDESLVQKHCASLAYGQFTNEEVADGTAWKILKKL
jgi:hypothetical protein